MTDNKKQLTKELDKVRHSLEDCLRLQQVEGVSVFCEVRCQHYAYVVENAPVSVIITDKTGLIEFVNTKFEEVSGYRSDEVIGKNPRIISSGEAGAHEYSRLWQAILTGGEWTGEFHNRRKNGELYWERAVIKGVSDEHGEIIHFIAIKEDITEVKQARLKLEQERLKLIQQAKMAEIGLMASSILHEVGNPIAAIRGLICDIKDSCSTLSQHSPMNKRVNEQLGQVLSEVDRITGITMDISEFTYSRHSIAELLDINALISTTCRLVQYDTRWSHIDLRLVLDEHLPPAYANRDHMVQVLINLLSNAAHAVEQVKDRLSTVRIASYVEDASICISIRDNGCGIHEGNLPRVFDTFFSTKEAGRGSGLGLALCKTLVDDQNGQIEIFSTHGESTEVRVSLPLQSDSEG
jgi:PAS domain S-box-containing protein